MQPLILFANHLEARVHCAYAFSTPRSCADLLSILFTKLLPLLIYLCSCYVFL